MDEDSAHLDRVLEKVQELVIGAAKAGGMATVRLFLNDPDLEVSLVAMFAFLSPAEVRAFFREWDQIPLRHLFLEDQAAAHKEA